MNEDAEAKIAQELSTLKPNKVKLYLPDGLTRELQVPKRAQRWQIVASIMASLPWDRAELLDEKNAVVGVLTSEIPEPDKKPAADEPRDVQLLRILKEAQGMVFTEMRETFGRALDSQAQVMETVVNRLTSMETTFQKIIDKERKIANTPVAAADEDDEEGGKRSVADELMTTVGKGLVRKFMGEKEGGGLSLDQIQEVIGKMDPEKVRDFLGKMGMTTGGGEAEATGETGSGGEGD